MATDRERYEQNVSALKQGNLDALVCGSATEVLLLTGYWPVMGNSVVVFSAEGRVCLIVPEDEVELAKSTSAAQLIAYSPAGLQSLRTPTQALEKPLREALAHIASREARIGVQPAEGIQPASYAAGAQFRCALDDLLQKLHPGARLLDCDSMLKDLRALKSDVELNRMQFGCEIAGVGFAKAEDCIRPGLREAEIAATVQAAFEASSLAEGLERSYGFFFCMSGPNAAKAAAAYARTRQRVVEDGDLVIIHANTCADGYWTDITRTYTAGTVSERHKKMRSAIAEAREAALRTIKSGVQASAVDRAARSVMEAHGFGEAFKHATGHGVGFAAANPNERPRIHPLSPDVLAVGMTFNVEPAAYFDGYGGMRHCDVVAVTDDGARVLTDF